MPVGATSRTMTKSPVSARGPFLIGSHDRLWDNAVIPTWPVERPLLAEVGASASALDHRRRLAAVAPGFDRVGLIIETLPMTRRDIFNTKTVGSFYTFEMVGMPTC